MAVDENTPPPPPNNVVVSLTKDASREIGNTAVLLATRVMFVVARATVEIEKLARWWWWWLVVVVVGGD